MSMVVKAQKEFSVIIPTYNRGNFLKKAISSVLRQKGVSFEIIVGDNASTDTTEKVVKNFKDPRINYFKNGENLGFAENIRICFKKAQGKYIFALGDDDFILDERTLYESLKIIKKYKVGVGSIGTIYYTNTPQIPCKTFILSDKLVLVKPRKDGKLPLRCLDFNISFFTGLIFNKSLIDIDKITNSFNYAYFPFVFDSILKRGMVYIPTYLTVAHISLRFVPQYFDISNLKSFYMEDYLALMKQFLSTKNFNRHKKEFLQQSAILLPSIKLFTNNKNYLQVLQRMIDLDRSLLWFPKFVVLALIGFLPKFILQFLRDLMIYREEKKIIRIVKKYNYFQELEKLGF